MTDRVYLILRNRIERRLEKPRTLIPHMALFTLYSVIAGTMSIITRPMGNMDGVFYWTIFFWSVIVSMHTLYAYLRSGAWATTRDRLVQEEILEASEEFHLSADEMAELHDRLSEDIGDRSRTFNKLAAAGAGYFFLWPGTLILLFIVQRLIFGGSPPDDNVVFRGILQLWQPLILVGTLLLSGLLISWRDLLPKAKSRDELYELYRSKGKREESDHAILPEFYEQEEDEGEDLTEPEENTRQNQNSAKR